uniref:RNA helicase n=1 Tax=Arcella intermedia TaxID=1963864 RepID=A0A6B2L3N9_9EUKA
MEVMEETAPEVTFASLGVPAKLCETIATIGWKTPSPIQRDSLPYSMKGRDVIGLAQTGSGKTGAFAIPIISALLENPRHLFACVLAPTRELAYQIGEQFDALGSGIGLVSAVVVGGMDIAAQTIALARKPHIVVGTPGRILYHLQNTKGFSLKSIRFLVMDEADRLLHMDFEEEINSILKVIPRERNTYLFSATMTQQVAKLQRASLVNPVKVQVDTKYQTVDKLHQNYLFIPDKYKDTYLVYLLNEFAGNSVIIFTIQCITCQRIALVLRNLGFSAIPLNGKMTQTKRLGALNKFKAKERNILVATDVASRGLDIPDVDIVINYDIPLSPKEYVHRVGRTARAGKSGRALNLVSQYDVENYQKIEGHIGKKLEVFPTEEDSVLILLERISEAQRLAAQQLRETGFGQKRKPEEENNTAQPAQKYQKVNNKGKGNPKGPRKNFKK